MLVMLVLLLAFQTAMAGKRVALVVGNSNYSESVLPNPQHDSSDMADVLYHLGFDVKLVQDVSRAEMSAAVQSFRNKLDSNTEVALFYYAGHGAQFANKNYLIPLSAKITVAEDLPLEAVDAGEVLYQMSGTGSAVSVMVLDACRDLPFRVKNRGSARGLAQMNVSGSVLVAYSTAPGNVAEDGNGRNSPYTTELLRLLPQPNLPLSQLFNDLGMAVKNATDNRQEPWISSSPVPRVYLGSSQQQQPVTVPPVSTPVTQLQEPSVNPRPPLHTSRRCAANDWKCQEKREGLAPGY
jgi:uncharacterized caspase-like protein